jgi:hypothetical protein
VLTGAQAGIGLGLGLFGILSIIRLRSDQITQEGRLRLRALALGLVNGLRPAPGWLAPAASAVLVPCPVADRTHINPQAQAFLADQLREAYGRPAPQLAANPTQVLWDSFVVGMPGFEPRKALPPGAAPCRNLSR